MSKPTAPLPEWEQVLSAASRLQRPVQILGRLDGIETGVRQLIRTAPLETEQIELKGTRLTVPTPAEMLRIKAVLVLKRNATRDYLAGDPPEPGLRFPFFGGAVPAATGFPDRIILTVLIIFTFNKVIIVKSINTILTARED